jgi:hypothetical protein
VFADRDEIIAGSNPQETGILFVESTVIKMLRKRSGNKNRKRIFLSELICSSKKTVSLREF